MRRLIYSPKVNIWIRIFDGRVIDVSDFVVRGEVVRKINEVSTAQIELRNPRKMWSQPQPEARKRIDPDLTWPFFHPMDPITIYLTRKPNSPVQVFTGYLDTVPYVDLAPHTVKLKASCTLKKILMTQWDPALPFAQSFMRQFGWLVSPDGTMASNVTAEAKPMKIASDPNEPPPSSDAPPNTPPGDPTPPPAPITDHLDDGSFKELLANSLQYIAGWDPGAIYVEPLPTKLVDKAASIFQAISKESQAAYDEYKKFIIRIIGPGAGGAGAASQGCNPGIPPGDWDLAVKIGQQFGIDPGVLAAIGLAETNWGKAGEGRNGYILGCGVPDSGPLGGAVGVEAQLICAATTLTKKGCHGIDDVKSGVCIKAYGTTDPAWSGNVASLYKPCPQGALGPPTTPGGGPGPNNPFGVGNQIPGITNPTAPPPPPPGVPGPGGAPPPQTPTQPVQGGQIPHCPDSKCYCPHSGGCPRGRPHCGADISAPGGAQVVAAGTGPITYTGSWGGFAEGEGPGANQVTVQQVGSSFVIYGHLDYSGPPAHTVVQQGTPIGKVDGGVGHIHFGVCSGQADGECSGNGVQNGGGPGDGCQDPIAWLQNPTSGGGGGGGDPNAYVRAAAFAQVINFPGVLDLGTAWYLASQGEKALMATSSLFPFIQELAHGSMRSFMSMPDGRFYAFYPDYFGGFSDEKSAYWEIDDLEILDGKIQLSDEPLATHVFVLADLLYNQSLGGDASGGFPNIADYAQSTGVVSIVSAIMGDFLNLKPEDIDPNYHPTTPPPPPPGSDPNAPKPAPALFDKNLALRFLNRYGARPFTSKQPQIRSPFIELIVAMQTFMLMWARQFQTDFQFTFMPELYPGGRVRFTSHGFEAFVEEVRHNFDFEAGFTTDARLQAPSTIPGQGAAMDALSVGMVRGAALDQTGTHPPTEADKTAVNSRQNPNAAGDPNDPSNTPTTPAPPDPNS